MASSRSTTSRRQKRKKETNKKRKRNQQLLACFSVFGLMVVAENVYGTLSFSGRTFGASMAANNNTTSTSKQQHLRITNYLYSKVSTLLNNNNNNNNNNSNSSNTSTTTISTTSIPPPTKPPPFKDFNVSIVMRFPRRDRMGSNVQRPVHLMAYAYCHGYHFCIAQGGQSLAGAVYEFPTCSPANVRQPDVGTLFAVPMNQSGAYYFLRDDNALLANIQAVEGDPTKPDCALPDYFRTTWRDMILRAPQSKHVPHDKRALAAENLFVNATTTTNKNVATVAVHVRRGDIELARGKTWVVPDEAVMDAIRKVRYMLENMGKTPEVHLFSESYGPIHWTGYNHTSPVLVDHFHLAPQMGTDLHHLYQEHMDIPLNVRDWRHFVLADVLIVGGTFSRIPSYARARPDPTTGLPLTITMCRNCQTSKPFLLGGTARMSWDWNTKDTVQVIEFPQVFQTMFDKTNGTTTTSRGG